MKKLGILVLALLPACAYGQMLEDAVDEVEGAIDNLDASQCIQECNDGTPDIPGSGMKACRDDCDLTGQQCEDEAKAECDLLPEEQVAECLGAEYELCDDLEEMCEETCGDVGVQCISDCVEEMEAELKDIDLDGSDS